MAIGRLNIGLTGVQPGGLAKVIPSSVAVGSGSGSVDSNGTVTFSGASSISLNNCFTSAYENYRIITYASGSAGGNAIFRLRASGTDTSTSIYYWAGLYVNTPTAGSLIQEYINAGSSWAPFYHENAVDGYNAMDIFRPQLVNKTCFIGHSMRPSSTGAAYRSGYIENTTQYDGFSITAGSGNLTGTIRVYGYN